MADNRLVPPMTLRGPNRLMQAPTSADAWQSISGGVGDYVAQQRAQAVAEGLLDPNTGMPTVAGMRAAGQAYAGGMSDGGVGGVMGGIRNAETGAILRNSLQDSRNVGYNPPVKPQRLLSEDYATGAPTDGSGRITADIDGNPLTAPVVAGRSQMGEAGMVPDRGIDPASIERVGQGAGGASFLAETQRNIGRQSVGDFTLGYDPITGARDSTIRTLSSLSPNQTAIVQGHEVGHLVDWVAGNIPTTGLDKELRGIYNTTQTGMERDRLRTGRPEQFGYSKGEAGPEMMAEAIRSYMVNPNYMKTVAPNTAERIRAYVNQNPQLSKFIQFNSAAGVLGAGANRLIPNDQQPQ